MEAPAPSFDAVDPDTFMKPGRYAVETRELVLTDRSRKTPANGTFKGSPERTLPTRVWVPSGGGPFPVLVYAHGFLSSNLEADFVAPHLASHGYVLAAPTFPLSNKNAPGGATIDDVMNQPADIGFVLRALSAVDGGDAGLARLADPLRNGIIGWSLGGATVMLAVYHPAWKIDAVGAAVAFAPGVCLFGRALYQRPLPTLIIGGDADMIAAFESAAARGYDAAPPPVGLLELVGGTHLGFLGRDASGGEKNPDASMCARVEKAGGRGLGLRFMFGLMRDVGPCAVSPFACERGCAPFVQRMPAPRQLQLARAAALAHFEATLRGRMEAKQFLTEWLPANNADIALFVKQ